jgi:hypothetical protein
MSTLQLRTRALQAAAKRGNLEMVQLLLEAGADGNAPPSHIGGVHLKHVQLKAFLG